MTPIEALVCKVEGEVRKSWVDYFKNREMIAIRDAFEAGKAHANDTPLIEQASGMDYYREIFLDAGNSCAMPDQDFWPKGE